MSVNIINEVGQWSSALFQSDTLQLLLIITLQSKIRDQFRE